MKKNAFWNVIFNYFPTIMSFITGFLLVPIYLKKINYEVYGLWLVSTNIINLISIIDPGLNLIIQQKISILNGSNNKKKVCDFITSSVIITFSTSILIFFIGLLYLKYFLEKNLNFSDHENTVFKYSFFFTLCGTSLSFVSYTLTSISQGFFTSLKIGLIYAISVVTSSIVLLIMIFREYGLFSIALSQFLTGLFLFTGNFILLYSVLKKNKLNLNVNKNNLFYTVKISLRTLVAKSSKIIIYNLDVFLINNFIGSTSVLPLLMSKKIPEILKSVIERPFLSLMPTAGFLYGKGDFSFFRDFISNLLFLLIWLIGFYILSVILLNKDFISYWVGTNFYIGDISYSLIVTSFLFQLLSNLLVNYYYSIGFNIRHTNNLSFIELACYLAAYVLLFSKWKIHAIFLSPIFASLVTIILIAKKNKLYVISLKEFHIFKKDIFITISLISLTAISEFHYMPANLFHVFVKYGMYVFLYIFLLFIISKHFRLILNKILNIF